MLSAAGAGMHFENHSHGSLLPPGWFLPDMEKGEHVEAGETADACLALSGFPSWG